ncbi:MAG TPA: neutral/alkaline non-lysosomal ceramidase N-terminal domain-containing protein [Bryobacteraceae bacterium]|nr:neutral/alkaline non-lysosomal ceramidase N-terminal domain-containing protein [Bryobacteraceae bacterium]
MRELLAGTGRTDISPAPGTPQGGWGAQTHQRGIGTDLPLYATALVLKDPLTTVAIIDLDSIGFDPELTSRILDAVAGLTGISRENIRFSCTHAHSGPNTFRLPVITEGRDMILEYMNALPLQIGGAVWQAQQNLRPVRIGAATGSCEINVNRRFRTSGGRVVVGRNWDGPVDRTVRVVRIDGLDEKPVATIVHYACHPTIMAWQTQYATPDYPGMAKKVVEEQLGGTCLFLQGATGDVGPRRGFTGDLNVYRNSGRMLGFEACKLALGIETLPRREKLVGLQESGATIALFEDEAEEPEPATLDVRSRFLQLPLKQFPKPEVAEAEAAALREELNRLRREGSEAEVREATAKATQAGMRADSARLYHGRTHIDWQLQAIRLGPVALISIPGEPFTETGQEIATRSPFKHTLFSGYSNGGFGYLPVRSAYAEGGYEVAASPFAEGSAELVVEQALVVLAELHRSAAGNR